MSLKTEKDKSKQLQDKCQSVLNALLRDDDNKYCVDCDSKGPRWASWNIGVFLCIRCAGIHRNLGVHISKVKSVNLDSWTPEQVVSLQNMGNSRARAVYEANLPDNFRRPQNDSNLESFIRAKYEHKKYIAREWVPPPLPKVNWQKEIDEEIEKQKRKKKTILEKKVLTNVEVPQLPKPANPSPKPSRPVINTPELKEKQKHNNGNSKDLLGTNGEDCFSSFISAVPAQNPATTIKDSAKKDIVVNSTKSEEESFFNQTLPVEKEKVKLDKDSILALYGSGPTIPQFQPFQGGFQSTIGQTQGGFGSFGGFPQTVHVPSFSTQNGASNQFMQTPNGLYSAVTITPTSAQFPQSQVGQQSQFLPNQFNAAPFSAAPQINTQYNNAANSNYGPPNQALAQQFGNLALNSTPATTPNLWQ
ncbi:stromal membrane-associated protein 1-like [Euwallacea fornicatus]|uniref:stromal membrane-associated protein 1-like n=1 Tax=Euwallacea fornicatus TaxID=995702 RepID=UPI00338FF44F